MIGRYQWSLRVQTHGRHQSFVHERKFIAHSLVAFMHFFVISSLRLGQQHIGTWNPFVKINIRDLKQRRQRRQWVNLLGSLSSDVFERRTSTGSEVFSLLTCLDDIKFVFLSFFTIIEAIRLKICAKPPSKNEKRPLPVDVHRSKTLLLKLPIREIKVCTTKNFYTASWLASSNLSMHVLWFNFILGLINFLFSFVLGYRNVW